MNILFLVTSFLLIFSFISASLLKNERASSQEQEFFCKYLSTKQKLFNKWAKYQFSLKKKRKHSDSPKKKRAIPSPYRLRKNLGSLAKWNLAPLLLENSHEEYLTKKTFLLLKELYGHTDFWEDELGEKLVLFFKEKKGAAKELSYLSDFFPEDPALGGLFYKMLKGSTLYDLEKKIGHPPLTDFFLLDIENPTTLSFPYASKPALTAFFGKELAEEIIFLEEEKSKQEEGYSSLSEEEFMGAASLQGQGSFVTLLLPHLSFEHKRILLEKLSEQDKVGPIIEQKLSNGPLLDALEE